MHTKLLSWFLLLGFSVLLTSEAYSQGAAAAAAPAAAATQPAGRIVAARVRGTVTATDKTTTVSRSVADGAEISQGSIVRVEKDSSVVLVFSNGATINLGADSVLDIQQFTQDPFADSFSPADATDEPSTSTTKLKLMRGELVGKVAKLKKAQGSSFAVETPVGAAGIRGTTFRIVFRPDGNGKAFFSMTTLEGDVEVTLATGSVNAPVSVTDNKEVVIADITVTVDAAGQVTVTTPTSTTLLVVDAPTTTLQQVTAAASTIAEAVANVVITSTGTTNNGNSNNNNSGNNGGDNKPEKKDDQPSSSGPTTPLPKLTNQDGK
jgi:hypothetical protein